MFNIRLSVSPAVISRYFLQEQGFTNGLLYVYKNDWERSRYGSFHASPTYTVLRLLMHVMEQLNKLFVRQLLFLSVTVAHANYYNAKETNIIKHFIRQSDSSRHSHCGKRLVLAKTGSPILALVCL
jgi:hypothetical protein